MDANKKHDIGEILVYYGGTLPYRRGGWTQMKCPFHGDSHASASVNLDENAFACFACGMKGDTYKIIMEHTGVDFVEAIRIAEDITGASIQSIRGEYRGGSRVFGKARSVARGREKRTFRSCG